MKIFGSTLFQKKEVALGKGSVNQYILFENKYLFSIIFYRWRTLDQIRFHSHAFASVAFLIFGWYWEKILYNEIEMTNFVNVPFLPRYLPRNYTHAIQNAKPGTTTMVITGPWQKHWYEYFPDKGIWRRYTWGRKKVEDQTEYPKELLQ